MQQNTRPSSSLSKQLRASAMFCALAFLPSMALASDHNEPSPGPVWPGDKALHKEWDLSDLFAWYDVDTDKLNFIVAWHPQQLPLDPNQRADFNDQVLFRLHINYQRKGLQLANRYFEREINFRYGKNADGKWGMLVKGLPGLGSLVLDCDSPAGAVVYNLDAKTGKPSNGVVEDVIQVGTGVWDDPFVFDLDGFNASLARALDGGSELKFDPTNDTFEGHNITAFVVSIPLSSMTAHWPDFNPSGFASTNFLNIWSTTSITGAEAAAEGDQS